MKLFETYLEVGSKKVFAGAVEWPGLCRFGKDEASALEALLDHAPRYAQVLRAGGMDFPIPADIAALQVVERIQGSPTTDFGAPEAVPSADRQPIEARDLDHFLLIVDCCWQALQKAAQDAEGKELRKGPRGGGRELDGVLRHVLDAQRSYLRSLAWKNTNEGTAGNLFDQMDSVRQEIHGALTNAVQGGLPEQGPRGGKIWTPRYFVRRSAWHILDHVWEIENRVTA